MSKTFSQKEEAILQKLQETDYAMFDNSKEEALDFLTEQIQIFPKYVNEVVTMTSMRNIWMATCDKDEYCNRMQNIDRSRKIIHDRCVDSVKILNRMSASLGLEPFADINTDDRHEVAKFVGRYVNEVYSVGIGENEDFFDHAVKENTGYNESRQKQRMQAAADRLAEMEANTYAAGGEMLLP